MTCEEKSQRRAAEIAGLKEALSILSERTVATTPDPATSHCPEVRNDAPIIVLDRGLLCVAWSFGKVGSCCHFCDLLLCQISLLWFLYALLETYLRHRLTTSMKSEAIDKNTSTKRTWQRSSHSTTFKHMRKTHCGVLKQVVVGDISPNVFAAADPQIACILLMFSSSQDVCAVSWAPSFGGLRRPSQDLSSKERLEAVGILRLTRTVSKTKHTRRDPGTASRADTRHQLYNPVEDLYSSVECFTWD